MNGLITIVILAFSILILGLDIGSFPLISPDEARYIETAKEMLERGNLVVPYCDYLPRFDKPILFYWLEILSIKAFGINELAARIPSVIAGSGMVCLAFILGSIQGYGLIAAAIMLSSLKIFLLSKLAITDMVLTFFISGAIAFFYLGYIKRQEIKRSFALKDKVSSAWFPIAWLMMGLGTLCKGPIALILPPLIIIIFLIIEKDLLNFIYDTWVDNLFGFIILVLVTIPWYLSVHFLTNGIFSQEFFLNHNIHRYLHIHSNHYGPFWYYVPEVLIGLFPWSFFLIQAIIANDFSTTKINLRSDAARSAHLMAFCSTWALITLIFFSICKTKLPTYSTPMYLPLVLIIANWWSEKFKTIRSNGYKNLDALIGLVAMILFTIAATIIGFGLFKKELYLLGNSSALTIAAIALLLSSAALIAMTAILDRAKIAFGFILGASLISYLIASFLILKPFAIYRDAGSKAFAIKHGSQNNLAVYKIHPTRFNFYSKQRIPRLRKKDFAAYASEQGKYLITKREFAPKVIKTGLFEIENKNSIYVYFKTKSSKEINTSSGST